MTVAELIAKLQAFDQTLTVVVDVHSEYGAAAEVDSFDGFDNGGYISHVYPLDHPRMTGKVVRTYVNIR